MKTTLTLLAAVDSDTIFSLAATKQVSSFKGIPLSSGISCNNREEMFCFTLPSKLKQTSHFAIPQAQRTVPMTTSRNQRFTLAFGFVINGPWLPFTQLPTFILSADVKTMIIHL